MGRVVEIPPQRVKSALESVGAEFYEGNEDERWRARHGGSVVAGHENGVVVYGGYNKVENLIRASRTEGEKCVVQFDGASRGNPGDAAIAYVLSNDDGVIKKHNERIGEATNNVAEYRALLGGLKEALRLGFTNVEAVGDSQLVVKQVRGDWECRSENLVGLHREARELIDEFDSFKIRHVPREANTDADRLANGALDQS
ncbi:MAG: ribonuclease HI family protein [Halobacteria archaeon]|nr:ribonuclease HI family protein [Halobacteria archaeon]